MQRDKNASLDNNLRTINNIFNFLVGNRNKLRKMLAEMQLLAVGYWPLALLRIGRFSHWTGAHKMRPYRIGQCPTSEPSNTLGV
jgi:hypothetical protein